MSGINFKLDPRLEQDSVFVCAMELCQVRLHRNAAFPWLMLVPQRDGMVEVLDLDSHAQDILWHEVRFAATAVQKLFTPKKLNIAAIGNITSQLHVHVIARYADDKAWPQPVWNSGVSADYSDDDLATRVTLLQGALAFNG